MKSSPAHQHKGNRDDNFIHKWPLPTGLEHRTSFLLYSMQPLHLSVPSCFPQYFDPGCHFPASHPSIRLLLPLSNIMKSQQNEVKEYYFTIFLTQSFHLPLQPSHGLPTIILQLLPIKLIHPICLGKSSTSRG